ncbi:hypothetical protein QF049_001383 [Paenibacillus sp. W4I10]|nr:hypothetical protein [Paenibacillus sp. W4I10]
MSKKPALALVAFDDEKAPRGFVVFYGVAGGDPAPVDPRMLMDTLKTLTGGNLWNFLT